MADFLALQIEPSTFCTLRCPTCPRTAFRDQWMNRHFPMEAFHRILPLAQRASLVLLQGWGEPLCHPEIHHMVQAITELGVRCTLTTNGCLLDEERGEALLQAGLTHMTVSISGSSQKSHGALRPPSDLYALMERIVRFRRLAEEMHKPLHITLSFLQQAANIHELPGVLALARRYGLGHCLAINASYLPTPQHADQQVQPGIRHGWASIRALWTSIRTGLAYIPAGVHREERAVCDNDPIHCFTIGSDGSFSPCIFLQLPLKRTDLPHPPTLITGSLFEEDFDTVWQKHPWRDFRETFERRKAFQEVLYADMATCSEGRRRLMEAPGILCRFFEKNPAPPVCRDCAKLYGL